MKKKDTHASTAVMEDQDLQGEGENYSDIQLLEVPPQEEWFVETTGPQGQPLVYLRFQATGLLPRRIGPFPSRAVAIQALERHLNNMGDAFSETAHSVEKYVVKIPCHKRWDAVLVEDPFTFTPMST